ncbi:MAG: hypothetical protein HYS86_04485, partial [Candidatus Chisholmbacteria bacterium]|nr:hypothetical protein [Candidatus Chisholmbacteria bacterium]
PKKHQLALIASGVLALSPWHIQLSRVAFEANLAATLNLAGVYFFLASRRHPWLLIVSLVSFVATVYTFNANRLLAPLLLIFLAVLFFKHLWHHKKQSLVTALVGVLLILPLVPHLRSPEGKLRWHEVNIFSNLDIIITSNERIERDGGGVVTRIIHHRYLSFTKEFLKHYFDHFQGRFLFLAGDGNPRLSTQNVGLLYLIELPFLLVGIYALVKGKQKTTALVLLGWFLLAPIPAATARETPHALRSISQIPTPPIISALGLVYLLGLRSPRGWLDRLPRGGVLVALYLLSLAYFQIDYYRYYPKEYAGEWLTAYPKLVEYLRHNPQAQTAQTITVVPDLNRPYIYFLFYNAYPPADFVSSVDRTGDALGLFTVHGFSKYRFERVPAEEIKSGDVYVVKAQDSYSGFQKLTDIEDITGKPIFTVLQKS